VPFTITQVLLISMTTARIYLLGQT
jgi:hypothetical protein